MNRKKNKFSSEHIRRLTKFADHLATCNVKDYPMEFYRGYKKPPVIITNRGVSFICFPFIYLELPNVFEDDWEYDSDCGVLFLYGENRHISYYSDEMLIKAFFGMSNKEILSCFVPYVSKDFDLHFGSTPRDVSRAIYLMIGHTLPIANRSVLIEKVL